MYYLYHIYDYIISTKYMNMLMYVLEGPHQSIAMLVLEKLLSLRVWNDKRKREKGIQTDDIAAREAA